MGFRVQGLGSRVQGLETGSDMHSSPIALLGEAKDRVLGPPQP